PHLLYYKYVNSGKRKCYYKKTDGTQIAKIYIDPKILDDILPKTENIHELKNLRD
ncbi:unnamed protein product, partial [marine sediment metagenome]